MDGHHRRNRRNQRHLRGAVAGLTVLAAVASAPVAARADDREGAGGRRGGATPTVTVLSTDALDGVGGGGTVGPGGALYVTNSADGTLLRMNPHSGTMTVVGTGLPPRVFPDTGGAMDVAFWRGRAYVIVMLAGPEVGGSGFTGVYRLDDDGTFSLFADIGAFASANPPEDPDVFLAEGVLYAMDVWRDRLVVTDGHHARVYEVDRQGQIAELLAFPDTDDVLTGVEVHEGRLLLATPGPIPHLPASSKVLEVRGGETTVVGQWPASYAGNRGLILDVEAGPGALYGLLQGYWDWPNDPFNEGFPAAHGTGELVRVRDGRFETVLGGLDQPTSLDFIGRSAFVVTLTGTVLRIDGI